MSTVNQGKSSSPNKQALTGDACANTHDGEVVSITGTKLVTKCNQGNEHKYSLDKDATITCDGKSCKTDSLAVGKKVRVTTKQDDSTVATNVESLNKQTAFAECG
jgi:hypothetical protein